MSSKIKSPTQKTNSFAITLIAVLAIVCAVIGYVVYNGVQTKKNALKASVENVKMEISTSPEYITLKGLKPAADAKEVDLYEDYSCPHCAELAEATDGQMKDQIESGKLVVHIRPLNFLDNQKIHHSSAAGSAAMAVAQQGDASLYWSYRSMLFSKQKDIYLPWKADDFAKAAEQMGANSKTVDAIKNETDLESFRTAAAANAKKLEGVNGKVSSPQVVFEGKALSLVNDAGDGFANWPQEVVDGKARFAEPEKPAAGAPQDKK